MAVSLNIPIVTRFLILSLKWPLIAQFGAFIASHLSDVPFFLFSRFFFRVTLSYTTTTNQAFRQNLRLSHLPYFVTCQMKIVSFARTRSFQ